MPLIFLKGKIYLWFNSNMFSYKTWISMNLNYLKKNSILQQQNKCFYKLLPSSSILFYYSFLVLLYLPSTVQTHNQIIPCFTYTGWSTEVFCSEIGKYNSPYLPWQPRLVSWQHLTPILSFDTRGWHPSMPSYTP